MKVVTDTAEELKRLASAAEKELPGVMCVRSVMCVCDACVSCMYALLCIWFLQIALLC